MYNFQQTRNNNLESLSFECIDFPIKGEIEKSEAKIEEEDDDDFEDVVKSTTPHMFCKTASNASTHATAAANGCCRCLMVMRIGCCFLVPQLLLLFALVYALVYFSKVNCMSYNLNLIGNYQY